MKKMILKIFDLPSFLEECQVQGQNGIPAFNAIISRCYGSKSNGIAWAVLLCALLQSFTAIAQSTFIEVVSNDVSTLPKSDLSNYRKFEAAPITDKSFLVKLGKIENFQKNGIVTFNLPEIASPVIMKVERAEYENANKYVWQGTQVDQEGTLLPGHLLLIKDGENLVGEIAAGNDFYLISSIGSEYQVLIKTKVLEYKSDMDEAHGAQPEETCVMGDEQCTIDVVILYTEECLDPYMFMGMFGRLCLEQMNAALKRSGIKQRTRLKGVFKWPGTWMNQTACAEAEFLKNQLLDPTSAAAQLKYAVNADLMVLLTSGSMHHVDNVVGCVTNAMPANAFENGCAVVNVNYALNGSYVYSHEVGHLMGGRHQNDTDDIPARAHEFDGTYLGHTYHYYTIMHTGVNQLLNYSNPDVQYLGVATGTPTRNNACKMQDYGCAVSEILSSEECEIKSSGTRGCDRVVVASSLKRGDESVCHEGVYWQFDYSYDGVNYVTGIISSTPSATIPFSEDCNIPVVFIRIKVYDVAGIPITNNFEWFDRTCECAPTDGEGAFKTSATPEQASQQNDILVYPNPSGNELLLDIPDNGLIEKNEILNFTIIDQLGNLMPVSITGFEENLISINISKLPAGSYLLRGQFSDRLIVRSFVKM